MTKTRPIHRCSPNGVPHPFKALTLCGLMVRFGGIEIKDERPMTCKRCRAIVEKGKPMCTCDEYDHCEVHGYGP